MPNPLPVIRHATTPPTDTNEFNQAGTLLIHPSPASGGFAGWLCTVEGRPGTWVPIALSNQAGISTLTAAATLPTGSGLVLINGGSGGTYTLAPHASHAAGFAMTVKNIANNNVTLATVAGATYNDAAAVTLTQFQIVTVKTDGTTWYKVA